MVAIQFSFKMVVRLFCALSTCVFAFATSVCANTLPNHLSYDDIQSQGSIEIAVYQDFPPFSSLDDGKLNGVDIELGKLIAEKLGVIATFRTIQAGETVDDDLRNSIWKGHYLDGRISNLMMHVPADREFARRNNMVVISSPYYDEQLVIARDLAKTGDSPTLAVYRYEKIGVELDSLPDFFLSGYHNGILTHNVVHYRTISGAAQGLLEGEIAAVFAPRSQIEFALKDHLDRYEVSAVAAPELAKDRWGLGVAVSAFTRQLGYAIDDILLQMVESGEVARLFKKYGLSYSRAE